MGDKASSRRRFIATVAGIAAVGVSGCGFGGSETAQPTDEETPTATPMEEVTPTAAATEPAAETATEAPEQTPTEAPAETETDGPEETATETPTPAVGELAEWPTYMYNNQNWGAHPDAVGPGGEVSVSWERELGSEVNATAALADGSLYVGSGAPDNESGQLYALDPITGDTLESDWPVAFDAPVMGGPAVNDSGVVYLGAGTDYVAHRSDGSRRWRSQINPSPNFGPTTVAGDYAYFAADSGRIARYDARTSSRSWEYFVNAAVESAPIVTDGIVYLGSRDGTVAALTTSGGNEEWTVNFDEPVNGLSMRDSRLYAALESREVVQLDTVGRERWRGRLDSGVATTPAVSGDLVYVGLRGDAFVALERSDGLERWRFDDVDDPFTASPVVVDGTVYVGCQNGSVYALDAVSGELEWSFDVGGSIDSPAPVVAGRTVYIGSRNGTFYALTG